MPDRMRASDIALVNHYQIARQQLRSYLQYFRELGLSG